MMDFRQLSQVSLWSAEVDVFQLLWLNPFAGHVLPLVWLGSAGDLLLGASAPWHMMAAAWLEQEARLVRWIDLLVKVSEFRSSQYLLCETYPAMHVQLAVRMYPISLCTYTQAS